MSEGKLISKLFSCWQWRHFHCMQIQDVRHFQNIVHLLAVGIGLMLNTSGFWVRPQSARWHRKTVQFFLNRQFFFLTRAFWIKETVSKARTELYRTVYFSLFPKPAFRAAHDVTSHLLSVHTATAGPHSTSSAGVIFLSASAQLSQPSHHQQDTATSLGRSLLSTWRRVPVPVPDCCWLSTLLPQCTCTQFLLRPNSLCSAALTL